MANTATAAAQRGQVLDLERFAAMVGTTAAALPPGCAAALQQQPLTFRSLRGAERETQLLRALHSSEAVELRAAGPHRAADWEAGWAENLQALAAGLDHQTALIPRYNRHQVLRLAGDYIQVSNPRCEYAFYSALRHYLFATWFAGMERVVEYGCGTGTSLLILAELFPTMDLHGLDWASSSQQILGELAQRTGSAIRGHRCDMFAPALDLPPGPHTGVLTSAAMEQLGERFEPLLEHLLATKPAICLHIEPLFELYDRDSLFDEVARRYHLRRNYLRGFLPRLQELAAMCRIEILQLHRPGFGSFHHEGYSYVVWRPRNSGACQ